MKKKILFTVGSPNQTTQMHQIARYLMDDYDCWFSQFYSDTPMINWAVEKGLLEFTIMGLQFKDRIETYFAEHKLQVDFQAKKNDYDLVVMCSDLLMPHNVRATRSVWVQEGMIDPESYLSRIVKALKLPRYWCIGTSLNGSSNMCDAYCVASDGYKEFFTRMGTDPHRQFVTGMPNFDNLEQHRQNDFPYRDYVMVATSDARETYRPDNRPAFIRRCVQIAAGRQLLFKLHPNEDFERGQAEIRLNAPADTLVFQDGNTNAMIANCAELITQYSTVVYVGIALGKRVHSYFDLDTLYRQAPLQNGGRSAANIADICRHFLAYPGSRQEFVRQYKLIPAEVPVSVL